MSLNLVWLCRRILMRGLKNRWQGEWHCSNHDERRKASCLATSCCIARLIWVAPFSFQGSDKLEHSESVCSSVLLKFPCNQSRVALAELKQTQSVESNHSLFHVWSKLMGAFMTVIILLARSDQSCVTLSTFHSQKEN